MSRSTPNSKRRLISPEDLPDVETRRLLASRVRYRGSPYHKRNPGDFGLSPPAAPRPGKTLCDEVGIFKRTVAEELVRDGLVRGMWSERRNGDFPALVWVCEKGFVLEAVIDVNGEAHGYPLADFDPLAKEVRARWQR